MELTHENTKEKITTDENFTVEEGKLLFNSIKD